MGILADCIRKLDASQKNRLRYHLKKGTRVIQSTSTWTDGNGAG